MWEKVKFLASNMWSFLRPLIRQFLTAVGPVLAAAATAAVEAAAQKAISSTEKREGAYAEIVLALEKQGLELGKDFTARMVNAAIEAAVAGLAD
ncbi:MAG: phage holin, LLH family [Geobacteraceae bacterium]|nr:phage holin, LLH family [Geobacteraceae bacterium]